MKIGFKKKDPVKTRKDIGQTIAGLFAKKKKKNESSLVGVIFSGSSGSSVHRIYSGCSEVLSERGFDTVLFNTGNSQAKEEKLLKELLKKGVRGLIIEPSKSQILCHHMDLYKKMDKEGTLKELRNRRHYEKPSEVKRRESRRH